jgi:hypothetical protein
MGLISFPPKQLSANFIFQFLNRSGKRRRRYMTLLRRSTEIQKFAGGDKVPDLVHFHGAVKLGWAAPSRNRPENKCVVLIGTRQRSGSKRYGLCQPARNRDDQIRSSRSDDGCDKERNAESRRAVSIRAPPTRRANARLSAISTRQNSICITAPSSPR